MKSYNQKDWLIKQITNAFEGVTLGDGVSLHETIVIDNYGSKEERTKARINDEKTNWKLLVQHPELNKVSGIGGPSFFDAKGMRFHLPAYMITSIRETYTNYDIVFHLCNLSNHGKQQLSLLNTRQRRAVRAFLKYLLNNGGHAYEFDFADIRSGLKEYWHADNDFMNA